MRAPVEEGEDGDEKERLITLDAINDGIAMAPGADM